MARFYETLINEKIQFDVYNFSKTDGTNKFLRYIENNHVSSLEFKPNLNILHSCQIYHPSSTRRYNWNFPLSENSIPQNISLPAPFRFQNWSEQLLINLNTTWFYRKSGGDEGEENGGRKAEETGSFENEWIGIKNGTEDKRRFWREETMNKSRLRSSSRHESIPGYRNPRVYIYIYI